MLNIILLNNAQSQGKGNMQKMSFLVLQELQSSLGISHLVLESPVSWFMLIPNQFLPVQ